MPDCRALISLLGRVTGAQPTMWGPSIVGFGSYRYQYESGRTGESCVTGFAVRGRELVVYLVAEGKDQAQLLEKLGPCRTGKSCLYTSGWPTSTWGSSRGSLRARLPRFRRRYPAARGA